MHLCILGDFYQRPGTVNHTSLDTFVLLPIFMSFIMWKVVIVGSCSLGLKWKQSWVLCRISTPTIKA